jgi:NAD(P)-dependent dehydrogenase (short-subunit alcohol dehydrogenase family)
MDMQLTNKKALVTGSTAGIGFAIASPLAHEGASVVVNGSTQRQVEQAVRRIRSSPVVARFPDPAGLFDHPRRLGIAAT